MSTPDHSHSQPTREATSAIEVTVPSDGADSAIVHTETVRVHIDRQPHKSPVDTTHEALYRLGSVPHDHVLFKEERGNREDTSIPRDEAKIRLSQDDHFYSVELHERGFAIIVNGRPKTVTRPRLSYLQVVALAFDPVPTGPNWVFTITYRNGPRANPEGTLLPDETVRLKKGMVFNVTATDKS